MGKSDYSRMTWNVDTYTEGRLRQYVSSALKINLDAFAFEEIKYMLLMYDKGSPLRSIPDFEQRRLYALKESGMNAGRFSDKIDGLATLSSDYARKFLIAFLRHQHSERFAQLVVLEKLLYEYLELLSKPLEESEDMEAMLKAMEIKGRLTKQLDTVDSMISKMKENIFEQDVEAEKVVMKALSPEYVSEAIK